MTSLASLPSVVACFAEIPFTGICLARKKRRVPLLPACVLDIGMSRCFPATTERKNPSFVFMAVRPVCSTSPPTVLLHAARGRQGGLSQRLRRRYAAFRSRLSGCNHAWLGKPLPGGVLSGILQAEDIARMDLRGTEMVVLSACQTGQGRATAEGLYGLQRAFKKAGVGTIVMSLWAVKDKATQDFMTAFYEHLLKTAPKATSVRRLKLPRRWCGRNIKSLIIGRPS